MKVGDTATVKVAKVRKAKVPTPPTPEVPTGTAPVATGTTGKFKGRGTCTALGIPAGLRRMAFQDRLMAANLKLKYDDAKLASVMDAEHPGGVPMRPDHIRAIRRLYNEGTHTKAGVKPPVPTPKYVDGTAVIEVRQSKSKAA